MLAINVSDEELQAAFQVHLSKLFSDTYNNPIKGILENMFSRYGSSKSPEMIELEKQVNDMVQVHMKSPGFALALGTAMAAEIAKREVDKMKK